MNTNDLFIGKEVLPEPLSKQEIYKLMEEMNKGDKEARKKLIEHNIRLVLYEVTRRFESVQYDKKDLVSIGCIGLIKAVETFDTSKNFSFITYAARCIDNEILMFLNKLKKYKNVDSLNKVISYDEYDNELKIEDIICDKNNVIEKYIENETYHIINQTVKELPKRDREIIMMYFGFYDDKIYTQKEIGEILSIEQSYVSRLIIKNVQQLRQQLTKKGILELRLENQSKNSNKTFKKNKILIKK